MIFKTTKKMLAAIFAFFVVVSASFPAFSIDCDPVAETSAGEIIKKCNQKIHDMEVLCSNWSKNMLERNEANRFTTLSKIHIASFKSRLEILNQNLKLSHNISVENHEKAKILNEILDSIDKSIISIVADNFKSKETCSKINLLDGYIDSLNNFLTTSPKSKLRKMHSYFCESGIKSLFQTARLDINL